MLNRCLYIGVLALVCAVLLLGRLGLQWRETPMFLSVGNNDIKDSSFGKNTEKIDPWAWKKGGKNGRFREPKIDVPNHFPPGKAKAVGSNYTRTLVVPKLRAEDTSWIEGQLGDMLTSGWLKTALYTMDDPTAPLHPIQNKGHEVMAYLSYIIDNYSSLPDIVIFMHAHRFAFHNNMLLDRDGSLMVRHLSAERVTREGYMNLRCHWDPGCPAWMLPGELDFQTDKREQRLLAASWKELFPQDPLPDVLAQPCCAQFAVSRERVHAIPHERFVALREWVLHTDLDDFLSGRIFEYTWQYIFTASAFHCPSMSACYCDGYGICFGDAEKFDYFFELDFHRKEYTDELEARRADGLGAENAEQKHDNERFDGLEPDVAREVWLQEEIAKISAEMEARKLEAFERGKDAKQRAMEAGREWTTGDGF